jgi:hypothetical protein
VAARNVSDVKKTVSKLSSEQQESVLAKSSVVDLAAKIEVARESADKLWEHGWLQGHPPGESINLDDMLDNDEDSD